MERTVDGQAGLGSGTVRSCRLDSTVGTVLGDISNEPRFSWATGSVQVEAGGHAVTITAAGTDRFRTVREKSKALFERLDVPADMHNDARPRLYGGFAFTERRPDAETGSNWTGFPAAWFTLPAVQVTVTERGRWLTTAAAGPDSETLAAERLDRWRERLSSRRSTDQMGSPGVTTQTYTPPLSDWQREIRDATAKIRSGRLRKVVLAQALTAELGESVDVGELLTRLGDSYPECFRFRFEPTAGGAFFGATPERLVSVDGTAVETEALAGSIGRGETTDEDEWLATQLLESKKNNHEHDIVVETVTDQLEPLTEAIQTGKRTIRKLANVQHLQTPIHATLSEPRHVLDLVEALHPTPAVGGLPPDIALQTIRETEVFDRGWYAAPVGWIDAEGNGCFAVAIRSAIAADRRATLFAGAGIVADSDPDEEWDELQLKYRPILDELV